MVIMKIDLKHLFLAIIFLLSCSQNRVKDPNGNNNEWLKPEQFTPISFIDYFIIETNQSSNINIITMMDCFPDNWVKKSDLEALIPLIKSTKKCNCFQNPISSYIPSKVTANVGGYAILFINSYRKKEKIKLGLNACPQTDKISVEEIERWWLEQKK